MKKMNDFAAVGALLSLASAAAAKPAEPLQLDTMTITVSKRAESFREVPVTVTAVKSFDIEKNNPQTSADLLGQSGGAYIQKSQQAGGSPMIRGFNANRVLLVVDGVRMNNLNYRAGNLQNVISIDPNSVRSAEIIYGPGSVIYGSDALGGVMSFTTKKPKLNNESPQFSPSVLLRYSSVNQEKTVSGSALAEGKKWGSLTTASISDFGDLKMGTRGDHFDFYKRSHSQITLNGIDTMMINSDPSILKGSAYSQINLLENLSFAPGEHAVIRNSAIYSVTSDSPRYDRLSLYKDSSHTALKFGDWYYGPMRWFMDALSVEVTKENPLFTSMKLIGAYQNYEESRMDRKWNKKYLNNRIENVNCYSFNADFDRKIGEKNTVMYGFEAAANTSKSTAYQENILNEKDTLPLSTRYPEGGSDFGTGGIYVQLKTVWNSALTANAGLRYSRAYLKSNFGKSEELFRLEKVNLELPESIEMKSGNFTGCGGVVYSPIKPLTLRLNLASGYRAPNVDDIAKFFETAEGTIRVPSQSVSAEKSYNIDFGTAVKLFDRLTIDGTVFRCKVKDMLDAAPSTLSSGDTMLTVDGTPLRVWSVVNIDEAAFWGGSGSFSIKAMDHLTVKTELSAAAGKDLGDSLPLNTVPPIFGSTHLIYENEKFRIDGFAQYNGEKVEGKGSQDIRAGDSELSEMPVNDEGKPFSPSWVTFNMKSSVAVSKSVKLDFGVENILDEAYRTFRSGTPAPGRNFYAGVRLGK